MKFHITLIISLSFYKVYQTEPELFKWFEFLNQDDIDLENLNENDLILFGNAKSEMNSPLKFVDKTQNPIFAKLNELETQISLCIATLQNSDDFNIIFNNLLNNNERKKLNCFNGFIIFRR